VVFVNDFEGQELPVLSFHLDDIQASIETLGDHYTGDGHIMLQSHFFNPYVLRWEPVVEPWALSFNLSMITHTHSILCSVHSERLFELTITSDFLRTISRTHTILFSGDATVASSEGRGNLLKMQDSHKFFNDTGISLLVDGGHGEIEVGPGESVDLRVKPVKSGREMGGGRKLAKYTRTAGLVDVMLAGLLGEQRKPLHKLRTDTPGSFIYPLKPVQESGRVYPEPVVEETYENERLAVCR